MGVLDPLLGLFGRGEADGDESAADAGPADGDADDDTPAETPAGFSERAEALSVHAAGAVLDFSVESLADLDEMAAEEGASGREVKLTYGGYLGEVLVREFGGEWVDDDGWGVRVFQGDDETTVAVFEGAEMSLTKQPVFRKIAEKLVADGAEPVDAGQTDIDEPTTDERDESADQAAASADPEAQDESTETERPPREAPVENRSVDADTAEVGDTEPDDTGPTASEPGAAPVEDAEDIEATASERDEAVRADAEPTADADDTDDRERDGDTPERRTEATVEAEADDASADTTDEIPTYDDYETTGTSADDETVEAEADGPTDADASDEIPTYDAYQTGGTSTADEYESAVTPVEPDGDETADETEPDPVDDEAVIPRFEERDTTDDEAVIPRFEAEDTTDDEAVIPRFEERDTTDDEAVVPRFEAEDGGERGEGDDATAVEIDDADASSAPPRDAAEEDGIDDAPSAADAAGTDGEASVDADEHVAEAEPEAGDAAETAPDDAETTGRTATEAGERGSPVDARSETETPSPGDGATDGPPTGPTENESTPGHRANDRSGSTPGLDRGRADGISRLPFRTAARAFADDWSDREFDFAPASLLRLDALIDTLWSGRFRESALADRSLDPDATDDPLTRVGAYYGEVLVENFDGEWIRTDAGEPAVAVSDPGESSVTVDVYEAARECLVSPSTFRFRYDALANRLGDDGPRARQVRDSGFDLDAADSGTADVVTAIIDDADAFANAWTDYDLDYSAPSLRRVERLLSREFGGYDVSGATVGEETDHASLCLTDAARAAAAYVAVVFVRHLDAQWHVGETVTLVASTSAGERRIDPVALTVACLREERSVVEWYEDCSEDLGIEAPSTRERDDD